MPISPADPVSAELESRINQLVQMLCSGGNCDCILTGACSDLRPALLSVSKPDY